LPGWFDFRRRCPYLPGCLARPLGFRGKSSGGGRGSTLDRGLPVRAVTVQVGLLLEVPDYGEAALLNERLKKFCEDNLQPGYSLVVRTESTAGVVQE
jgi:hypothetical protein